MCAMRTYVSLIVLVDLCKSFYTSYGVFTIIFTVACPSYYSKSLFSIRHFAVDTCPVYAQADLFLCYFSPHELRQFSGLLFQISEINIYSL